MAKHITWIRLFNRLGKQPVKATKRPVTVKHEDKLYEARLVFTDNGSRWYLETTEEIKRDVSQ